MSCGRDHYEPISFDRPSPLDREAEDRTEARPKRPHGGRRPGAGAPRGNLNALKHGRNSSYQQRLLAALVTVPEIAEALAVLAARRRKQQRKAEAGAAALLSDLLRRTGEVVLAPEDNQPQNNQELLVFLQAAERRLREILAEQSSSRAKTASQSSTPKKDSIEL